MNTVKRWLAGLLSAAMIFTSAGLSSVGSLAVFAARTYTVSNPTSVTLDYTGSVPDLSTVDALASITISSGAKLTRGTDYTVEASSAGPADAQAIFKTIAGSAYEDDTIAPVTIKFNQPETNSSYTATVDTSKFVYDGTPLTVAEVVAATTVLKDGIENIPYSTASTGNYNVAVATNDGSAGSKVKVTITINGLTGDDAKIYDQEVTIAQADLKDLFLTGTLKSLLTYNGEAQNAEFTEIRYALTEGGDETVLPEADYTVGTCSNNVNAGDEAVATITAKSTSKNFKGSGTVKYSIGKFNLSGAYAQVQPSSTKYNGGRQEPEFGLTVAFSNNFGAKVISDDQYKVTYPTNSTDAATAPYNVKIQPKTDNGNLKGELEVAAYTITKASLEGATKTDKKPVPAGTLSVGAVAPAKVLEYFTIKVGDYELKATDFNAVLSGDPAKKGETCTIKLTGTGANFEKDYSFTFVTGSKVIEGTYVSSVSGLNYTGSQVTPTATTLGTLTVKGGAATITTADYDVTGYKNNINAGTAIATIKGKGQYEGTAEVEFKINPMTLSYTAANVANVTGIKEGGTYFVGAEIADATVTFVTGSTEKKFEKDDVKVVVKAIAENKITEVTISYKGNYTGTAIEYTLLNQVPVTIADLENAVVTGEVPAGLSAYNEASIKNYITVKIGDIEIGKDGYHITDISRVPAAASGSSEAVGDLGSKISFTIIAQAPLIGEKKGCSIDVVQRDITDLTVDNITIADAGAYDGTEKKPAVTVSVTGTDAKALTANVDYEIKYDNNKDAGTATVTVTGKGNYKSSLEKGFVIAKKDLTVDDFKLVGVDSVEYKSGDVDDLSSKLTLTKKIETSKLEFNASDYKIELVSGQKDKAVGSDVNYKVSILESSKNYNRQTFASVPAYKVVQATLSDVDVTIEKPSVTVGTAVTTADYSALGTITVKSGDKTLVEGTDYDISIEGERSKVTSELTSSEIKPAVVVELKGSYAGKKKVPFTIVPAVINIKDVNLVAPTGSAAVYSGSEIEPAVRDGGKNNIVADNGTKNYYTIVYKDADDKKIEVKPVNAGTYTATVVATATYGGEEGNSVTYTITKKNLSATQFNEKVAALTIETDRDDDKVSYAGKDTEAPGLTGPEADQFEITDYDKTWDGKNTSKGKAKVALKSDANYAYDGTGTVEYSWAKGTLDVAKNYKIADQTYTGKAIEPGVKDVVLVEGSDASLDWVVNVTDFENNINISEKTAHAWIEVKVPSDNLFYNGTINNWVSFTIKADANTAAADAVTEQLNALKGEGAALDDKAAVEAARKAYDELSAAAKAKVDSSALANLEAAEKAVEVAEKAAADQAAADAVAAKLSALTDASTEADQKAAVDAYNALTSEQKAIVDANADVAKKLSDAQAAVKAADDKKAAEEKEAAAKETATKTATTAKTAAAKVASTNPKYSAVQSAVKALDKVLADTNATSAQIQAATKAVNDAVTASKTAGAKKGATYTVGGQKYKATSTKAVTLTKAKNAKSVTVPATVKINGKNIAVTKIGAKAFAKSKATKITIKTKKLTKKGVKNSLKGSKVKTVKVSCGKAYVKKYKKFFTKANAGKKVTVK